MSSKDNDEERVIKWKSDSIEIMTYDNADEGIEKLFESLLSKYQIGLETSMRDSDFIFGCVYTLYYKCQKINFKQGDSYIDSAEWTKNKTPTINPTNKKDN